ncbi:uncharacterized protein LOC126483738 [Schistocerca serialis cubense]|uniref:uncharacterized protein LOC126483738 n=1 Tax=Schistocerca serialis cubense TaxID=2023355 RepID=UPI00214E9163|nr:uncharacterized protein LOC126483738 [Schistocerca serialis cubense]
MRQQPTQRPLSPLPQHHSLEAAGRPTVCFFTVMGPAMPRTTLHCLQNSLVEKGYLSIPCNILRSAGHVQLRCFDDVRMPRQLTQWPLSPLPQPHLLEAAGWPAVCFFGIMVKIAGDKSLRSDSQICALASRCLQRVLGDNKTAHSSEPFKWPATGWLWTPC